MPISIRMKFLLSVIIIFVLLSIAQVYSHNTYFPFLPHTQIETVTPDIRLTPIILPTGEPSNGTIPPPNSGRIFEDNESEDVKQFAVLLTTHPEQKRTSLTRHSLLAETAKDRCEDMATRNYFSHTNPDGYGPNYIATQNGFELPDYYSKAKDGNNIESIAAGMKTAQEGFNLLMNSPPHKMHLMGLEPFYAAQPFFGIYAAPNSEATFIYLCVIISEMRASTSGE